MPPHDNKLLHDLGLDTLPKGEQDELNADIGEVVFAGVMRRVWDVLDLHQQDALMSLLRQSEQDPNNEERRNALTTFLDTQVPDFGSYVQDELNALTQAHREAQSDTV